MNKKIFLNTAMLILLSTVVGLIYNIIQPDGIPLFRTETKLESLEESSTQLLEENVFGEINLKSALKLYENDAAIFIDARDQWEYSEGHIKGAINMPEFSFDPELPFVRALDKNQLFVLYCDADDCDVSKRLAEELKIIGFKKLLVYTGGWHEWKINNLPVQK